MKKIIAFTFAGFTIAMSGHAQFGRLSPADSIRRDSINRVTQQDYDQMFVAIENHFYAAWPIGQSAGAQCCKYR